MINDDADFNTTISLYRNYTPTAARVWHKALVKLPGWRDGKKARTTLVRELVNWCSDNCTGKWTYESPSFSDIQPYYFKNKRDHFHFSLVWVDLQEKDNK